MTRTGKTTAALAWAVVASGALSGPAVGQGSSASEKISLQYKTGGAVGAVYTPVKLLAQGKGFGFQAAHGKIKVAGYEILVAGRYLGTSYSFGVDCDADGKIQGTEWLRVTLPARTARFQLALPEGATRRPIALRFVQIAVGVRMNQAISLSGRFMVDGCMAGELDGHAVWLYDEDLDGKYSQDGKDAIAISGSVGAMPLFRRHQIGDYHYELDVDPSGTSITARRLDDLKLGRVETVVSPSVLGCLMLVDEANGASYDVKASGKAGIPAGTYKLAYAVLGGGKRLIVAGPSPKSPEYTIAENAVNVLRFGPPFVLVFDASFRPRERDITVHAGIKVYGTGGAQYHLGFAGYHRYGENPHVVFANGQSVLTSGHMAYNDNGGLSDYREFVPNGISRKTGRVVLTCNLPVLGKAAGDRMLADVLNKTKVEPPSPLQPTVAVRELPAGTRLGALPPTTQPAPKPKPVAVLPPPKPQPKTRPAKPRTADPEFEADSLLSMAKAFLKQGKKKLGAQKLKEIVDRYPKTGAAKKADNMLIEIQVEEEMNK